MYEDLTRFLPQLENEKACSERRPVIQDGEGVIHFQAYDYLPWVRDFERAVYAHDLPNYLEILDNHGFTNIESALENLDESDTEYVMAVIFGAVRSERFTEGNLKALIESRMDDLGGTKLVNPSAMTTVLTTMADKVRLLIFNACFSESQAVEVVSSVQAAIGMSTSIDDNAAVVFASALYSAIGFGLSLKRSFNQARAALAFDFPNEVDTPRLYVADGCDADQIVYVSEN